MHVGLGMHDVGLGGFYYCFCFSRRFFVFKGIVVSFIIINCFEQNRTIYILFKNPILQWPASSARASQQVEARVGEAVE